MHFYFLQRNTWLNKYSPLYTSILTIDLIISSKNIAVGFRQKIPNSKQGLKSNDIIVKCLTDVYEYYN